jgi:hypothetical protein
MKLRALVLVVLLGCTYRTPQVHVPTAFLAGGSESVDVTDVVVLDRGEPAQPEVAKAVAESLRDMLDADASDRRPHPASTRMSLRVNLLASRDWVASAGRTDGCGAAAVVLVAPTGLKIEDAEVAIDAAVESNGHRYSGSGMAQKDGSIYVSARRRSLAVALNGALTAAAAHQDDVASAAQGNSPGTRAAGAQP